MKYNNEAVFLFIFYLFYFFIIYYFKVTMYSINEKPPLELLDRLSELVEDSSNTIFLVSGRSKQNLHDWFGHLPIGLVAEYGFKVRYPPAYNKNDDKLQPEEFELQQNQSIESDEVDVFSANETENLQWVMR